MTEVLNIAGKIAGLAGLVVGVFLLLFKEVIRKRIFPRLTKKQSYKIIRLFLALVWSIALFGIVAWTITEVLTSNKGENENELKMFQKEYKKFASSEKINKTEILKPVSEKESNVNKYNKTQKHLIENSKDSGFAIIHSTWKKGSSFSAIMTFTIMNRTENPQVIVEVELEIVSWTAIMSPPETRVVDPVAKWNILLPGKKGINRYIPKSTVYVAPKDAVNIDVEFLLNINKNGKMISLIGSNQMFKIRIAFLSDTGLKATSESIELY